MLLFLMDYVDTSNEFVPPRNLFNHLTFDLGKCDFCSLAVMTEKHNNNIKKKEKKRREHRCGSTQNVKRCLANNILPNRSGLSLWTITI